MNIDVASYKFCEVLYELSGWSGPHWWYRLHGASKTPIVFHLRSIPQENDIPAYDLGYLLRKLPLQIKSESLELVVYGGHWEAAYTKSRRSLWGEDIGSHASDTPEDAVCSLAIELFRQDYLGGDDE